MQINVSIYLIDISEFNDNDMDFRLDFVIYTLWILPEREFINVKNRLNFVSNEYGEYIIQPKNFRDVWQPDTYFPSAKDLDMISDAVDTRVIVLRRDPTGNDYFASYSGR